MNLKKAKDLSTLELMHTSNGFWTEVLSMARRVINVIRSCALAYLLTIAVLAGRYRRALSGPAGARPK
jgi:hypothetical protein